MTVRTIAREARLAAALEGLNQARSRAKQLPSTLIERQRGDHRITRRDSTKPAAVLATVAALSAGGGLTGVIAASGGAGGYYSSSGGGFGGGGELD